MESSDVPVRFPRVGDFDERPPAEATVIINGGDPQVPSRGDLGSLVLSPFGGGLDNELERAVLAVWLPRWFQHRAPHGNHDTLGR